MTDLDRFEKTLLEHRKELERDFSVSNIGLFGSYVREDQAAGSDLDILVEFSQPISLLRFVNLKRRLSQLLDVEVDLVMKKALKPRIDERILSEVVYI
ncbi:MAG: nucleotidyltransferase family protein [Actinomycetota bacterium]|nr:nucleotidyltransferase family protein [Actinomycetota bacterium]